jgi:DNA polymerase
MPRKYWRNLPEAELIGELVAGASQTTQTMIDRAPGVPKLRAPRDEVRRETLLPVQGEGRDGGGFKRKGGFGGKPGFPSVCSPPKGPERGLQGEGWDGGGPKTAASSDLETLRSEARGCTACPLYRHATQTVFGEGPAHAGVMFVGEQPGDQEDLAGRPFVGPAGRLFDRALAEAGVARDGVYVTNAVKHFKFEPRGKRRLHKTPGQLEIEACRGWLEREIRLVRPRLIVALGATAANSVLGRPTPIQRNRGKTIAVSDETQVLITVHPSYLLRVPEAQQAEEYRRFVEDLRLAAAFAVDTSTAAYESAGSLRGTR